DVLQYSRLARSELRLSPVNVQELLRGIIESYPAFQPPRVEIQIEGPLPIVLGNEAALTQCFSNLLGNAVKFVAPGVAPRIRVWAEEVRNAQCGMRNEPADERHESGDEQHGSEPSVAPKSDPLSTINHPPSTNRF